MEDARNKAKHALSAVVQDDKLGHSVETAAFNSCIRTALQQHIPRYWDHSAFRKLYTSKIRTLVFNLRDPTNPELRQMVQDERLAPKPLVNLTPQQMHPQLWEEALHNRMVRDVEQDTSDTPEGIVQCKKCKSKKVQWQLKQCRSADEPATVYAWCVSCRTRFRFSS